MTLLPTLDWEVTKPLSLAGHRAVVSKRDFVNFSCVIFSTGTLWNLQITPCLVLNLP